MNGFQRQGQHSASRVLSLLIVAVLHLAGFYALINATGSHLPIAPLTVLHTKILPPDPPVAEQAAPIPIASAYPPLAALPDIPLEVPVAPVQVLTVPLVPKTTAPPVRSEVSSVSQLMGPVSPPVKISRPHKSDKYPGKSVKNRESGRTELKMCIARDGTVNTVEIMKSSGYPRLDAAAIDVAKDTLFKPATQMGKPVEYCMLTGIRFSLN